jgi:hypothetical protein
MSAQKWRSSLGKDATWRCRLSLKVTKRAGGARPTPLDKLAALKPIREAKADYTVRIDFRVGDTGGWESLPKTGIGAMGGIDCTQKDA